MDNIRIQKSENCLLLSFVVAAGEIRPLFFYFLFLERRVSEVRAGGGNKNKNKNPEMLLSH